MSKKSNKTVLETILDWSVDRPFWQRDALRRIVTGGTPNEAALSDLLALCKKEHGADDIALEPLPLEAGHLPARPVGGESVALVSLGDIVVLVGVSAMARQDDRLGARARSATGFAAGRAGILGPSSKLIGESFQGIIYGTTRSIAGGDGR
ncbi:hypothetical protein [Nitrobacter sp.]|uniref:hypothetical protein n=1 Tax=Nitrobacter sp. TaxID=29420 RepID=UPI00399D5983